MKPRPFDYVRPDSADEAIAVLTEYGDDARVLAGGQSLMAMLNLRLADPAVLVDIARIPELDAIRDMGGRIEVGAAVTQNKLLAWPDLAKKLPLLAAALPHVGHFQTRNKGTVCGSIAHADPSAELAVALVALGGTVVVESRASRRAIGAADFFTGTFETALEPGELLVETVWPVHEGGCAFEELSLRHGDYALAMCAVVAEGDGLRVALGSVVDRPLLVECPPDPEEAAEAAAAAADPVETIHATAEYRRHATRVLVRRATERALA
jgi:2-furoyl-CoA dehydrogenase FAD binding subunit